YVAANCCVASSSFLDLNFRQAAIKIQPSAKVTGKVHSCPGADEPALISSSSLDIMFNGTEVLFRSTVSASRVSLPEVLFLGGMICSFHLISGRITFISETDCMTNSGKKLVQLCHSVFGLKLKPASACGLLNVG